MEFDLAARDVAAKLFDWAEASVGAVDILVNNAAHYEDEGDNILSITAAGVDQTLCVNIVPPSYENIAVYPHLGYQETGREEQDGFARTGCCCPLDDLRPRLASARARRRHLNRRGSAAFRRMRRDG
jgi:NAD(P)-dependent dehydrogenase (short-subunit alcohol dehydrogenase family)